jgi:hypothetical protein
MDPIRLYADFKDDNGLEYRLNIHQAGWQVSPFEFNLGADGFTLQYSGDNENRMQPIIGSELTFTLIENAQQHTNFIGQLANSEDAEFTVSVWKGWQVTNELFWTGVLLSEQISLMDEAYPIQNTFNAVDELGNLANTLYTNDGTAYTGRDNIAQHIYKCLLKTRALHVYNSTDVLFKYANNFYPTTDFQSTNALIESEVNHSAFYNQNENGTPEFFDTFKVLQDLAITFNSRVFFAEGVFYFIPIGAVTDSTYLSFYSVTKGGTVSSSATAVDVNLEVGEDVIKLAGGSTTFLPPLQKVQRIWETNANLPVLFQFAQFLNSQGLYSELIGTEITDDDLVYEPDTVLRLQFRYNHSYSGGGTFPVGEDILGRLVLRLRIQCGTLFLANSVTFGPDTTEYGNYQSSVSIDNMNISGPAWASSGFFYIPLTPDPMYFDRNTGQIFLAQSFFSNVLEVPVGDQNLLVDLPVLPSQQTGLSVTATIMANDHSGAPITDINGANAYGKLSNIAVYAMTGAATNGDQVVYEANTGNNGQLIVDQPSVEIGSGTFDNHKNIYDNIGQGEVINEWSGILYPQADTSIHSLGVQEIIAGQNNSTMIKRGGYYKRFVSPLNTLEIEGGFYLPFQTSFIARPIEGEFEAWQLDDNDEDIVVPQPEVIDTHDPQDDSEPVYNIRNTFAPDAGNIAPNVFRRLLQQPVTAVNNSDASTYQVTAVDYMVMNTWTGANGRSFIYLPSVTGNEGRTVQFHSDETISANKNIQLEPHSGDTGVTIDGAGAYAFNRSYDGITILCHNSNWFIIQKKEK